MKLTAYCDGASRGNPGPSAHGYVLFSGEEIVEKHGETIGQGTNNEAEYRGLIEGLNAATKKGASEVEVRSDSELLVKQLNGQYKVMAANLHTLFQKAKKLLEGFSSYEVRHVPRENNKLADALCNEALDLL